MRHWRPIQKNNTTAGQLWLFHSSSLSSRGICVSQAVTDLLFRLEHGGTVFLCVHFLAITVATQWCSIDQCNDSVINQSSSRLPFQCRMAQWHRDIRVFNKTAHLGLIYWQAVEYRPAKLQGRAGQWWITWWMLKSPSISHILFTCLSGECCTEILKYFCKCKSVKAWFASAIQWCAAVTP